MAKPWREVISSDQYQKLSSADKQAAQEDYFDNVVSPRLTTAGQIAQARNEFFTQYPVRADVGSNESLGLGEIVGQGIGEAGRSIITGATNVANIPGSLVNMGLETAGVPKEYQVYQIPQIAEPKTGYGKVAAEILPYMANLPGSAARGAAALAANSGKIGQLASKVGTAAEQNVVGALAGSQGSSDKAAEDLGVGAGVSLATNTVLGKLGKLIKPGNKSVAEKATSATNAGVDSAAASRLAAEVAPDQKVLRAIDEMGIERGDVMPSVYSTNPKYIELEQRAASATKSTIEVDKKLNDTLLEKARALQSDLGAAESSGAANASYREKTQALIDDIRASENKLYNKIEEAIPRDLDVSAKNTLDFLHAEKDVLKGRSSLDPTYEKVMNNLSPIGGEGSITFEALKREKRRVGEALFKNKGAYADAQEYELGKLYGLLKKDIDELANSSGMGDVVKEANRLTVQRKGLEKGAVELLGKEGTKGSGSVTIKGDKAVESLAQRDAKGFADLRRQIPDAEMRREVISTGMQKAWSKGSRKQNEFNPTGFADWYAGVKAGGNLKELAKEYSTEQLKAMENLYIITNAMNKSNAAKTYTGITQTVYDEFGVKGGVLDKLLGGTAAAAAGGIAAKIPFVGGAIAYPVLKGVAKKISGATGKERAFAASEFLANDFREYMAQVSKVTPQNMDTFNKTWDAKLRKSPYWKNIEKFIDEKDHKVIRAIGITGWITSKDGDEE